MTASRPDFLPLSIEELANGYCLFMANAYRLIEDGEKLAATRRHLGAIGCFQAAVEEIVRGHLLEKVVAVEESDAAAWNAFGKTLDDRSRLLDVLTGEIHQEIYRSGTAQEDHARWIPLLHLDFVRTRFDGRLFVPPGGNLAGLDDMESAARGYYKYVLGLFNAFNFFGLPNPAAQLKTFWGLRAAARNQSLLR